MVEGLRVEYGAKQRLKLRYDDSCLAKLQGGDGGGEAGEESCWHISQVGLAGAGGNLNKNGSNTKGSGAHFDMCLTLMIRLCQ